MNKPAIIEALNEKYNTFIEYINSLTPQQYAYSYNHKWTAGQQLEHIVLCVKPLVQVFSMDSTMIAQNFGTTTTPSRTYDGLLKDYLEKLNTGGKAPGRYVPPTASSTQKEALVASLSSLLQALSTKIDGFSEQDLDTLCIPHPLLGSLTMREMLYNAIYHVQHHQQATATHLANK